MKNTLLTVIICCICLCYACKSDKCNTLLKEAQDLVDNDPLAALVKLDSISDPKDLDMDQYMQYILTKIQAKYKTYQDITTDDLILSAAAYFEEKDKHKEAALAHQYAGNYYLEKNIIDSSFFHFNRAFNQAELAKDSLLLGKSNHSIAYLYYESGDQNNAISYYHKALSYYNKINSSSEVEGYEIDIQLKIGLAYYLLLDYDKAYHELSKGLQTAKEEKNYIYESKFNLNLGAVFIDTQEYKDALKYLIEALPNAGNFGDSTVIYLNLALSYTELHKMDSANYYTNIVEERLPTIKDNYTLEVVYYLLTNHNEKIGNLTKALYYEKLEKNAIQNRMSEANLNKLSKISDEYTLSVTRLELSNTKRQITIYVVIGSAILSLSALLIYIRLKSIV